jgi:membrane protein implicated in regulation of membrane protease activity
MKSTQLTQGTATLILGLYLIYGVFALPFAGVLVSLAIGLIAYGTLESLEMSVALAIVVGVLYTLIARSGAEQYAEKTQKMSKEGFTDGASAIADRVARIKKATEQGPKGVYASAFVEGFADASTATNGTVQNPTAQTEMKDASAQSNPASAQAPSTAGSGIPPPPPPPVATQEATKKPDEKQGFKGDSGTDGMFKLGVLPDEKKGGYHIDAGTTVVNALNALKPDQVKAMTEDTQKLIETQKSLLGMLSNMKPMLQDGKQMMETFQEMFGNGQLKL